MGEYGTWLDAFIKAGPAGRRRLVEDHAELVLDQDLVNVLERIARDNGPDGQIMQHIAEVLRDCMKYGISRVFDFLDGPRTEIDIPKWLTAFYGADTAARRQMVEDHIPGIVNPRLLALMSDFATRSGDLQPYVESVVRVLEACARDGVGAVFDRIEARERAVAEQEREEREISARVAPDVPFEIVVLIRELVPQLAGNIIGRFDLVEPIRKILPHLKNCGLPEPRAITAAIGAKLGDILRQGAEDQGEIGLSHEAIESYDRALEALGAPEGEAATELWASIHLHRGKALLNVGERSSNSAAFREAIAAADLALPFVGDNFPVRDRATVHSDKAYALTRLADFSGGVKLPREAAVEFDRALALLSEEDDAEDWATVHSNRGSNLHLLAQRTGELGYLHAAIESYDAALRVRSEEATPEDWATTHCNRGNSLRLLGRMLNSPGFLREALQSYQAAMRVQTGGGSPSELALTLNGLANTYCAMSEMSGDPDPLRLAIKVHEFALDARTASAKPFEVALNHSGKGLALFLLGDLIDDREALIASVASFDASLAINEAGGMPAVLAIASINKCSALLRLWKIDRDRAHLLAAHEAAQVPLREMSFESAPDIFPGLVAMLGGIELLLGNYDVVAELLPEAVRLAGARVLLGRTVRDRKAALGPIARTAAELAYARLRLGDVAGALATIGHGRGVQLSLSHAIDELDRSSALGDALNSIRSLRQAFLDAQDRHASLQDSWQRARFDDGETAASGQADALKGQMAEIERQIGVRFEAFRQAIDSVGLAGPPAPGLAELAAALPDGNALVAILVTDVGGAAIIVTRTVAAAAEAQVLWLDALDSDRVDALLNGTGDGQGWAADYETYKGRAMAAGASAAEQMRALADWNGSVEAMQEALWRSAMGALDDRLRALGLAPGSEIVLMVPGRLSILPLHAAAGPSADGTRRCFLDDWTVSQVATLQSVVTGRRRASRHDPDRASLLAVTDPRGDLKGAEDARPLDHPGWELFDGRPRIGLREGDATVGAVASAMSQASHVSFYCHGRFDRYDAERSGLVLAGDGDGGAGDLPGILTVARLRGLDLAGNRLVVLGACETALLDRRSAPDEFIGLPSAMMEAGVPAVIASGWLAYTDTTRALTQRFLDLHLHGVPPPSPAGALRQATLELRDGKLDHDGRTIAAQFGSSRQSTAADPAEPSAPTVIANHHWAARWAVFSAWGV